MQKYLFLLTLGLLLLTGKLKAQSPNYYAHTGLTFNSYNGELSSFSDWNASFHVGLQLNRKERVNGNINLGFGSVTGENSSFRATARPPLPNRFFKTNFFFVNYDLHYNLIKKETLVLYLSQGIGLFRFNPLDENDNPLQDATNSRAEGETYRNAALMLPTSIGAIYLLPNQYGISLQAGFSNILTDYLDNISELGRSGNDNVLTIRIAMLIPIYTNK